uniref:Uncharacterized protein n=3 Tax=Rhizophagus irregularis TaxID=588596 RepID=U9TTH1_RHIID
MLYQAATGLKARQERDKWQLARDLSHLTKEEKEDQNGKCCGAFFERQRSRKGLDGKEFQNEVNILTPQTPPDRVYMGLSNMATRNKQNLTPTEKAQIEMEKDLPDEEEIVNMIKEWRVRDKEESGESDDDLGFNKLEELASKPLKHDNVATDEVVKIIKEYRSNEKIKYVPYHASTNESEKILTLGNKLSELEEIFDKTSNEMEWENINLEALRIVREENDLDALNMIFKDWAMKKNNFLWDENRLTDEREIGEKHPILESPPPQSSKKNEREEEEEKARIGRGMEGI